jgi:ATP-dependent phosphofructokinase / diphosphate-dependent phosphofructokinase
MKNLLFVHGGGPTAVINASLAGAIEEAKREGFAGKILAARYGSQGLVKGDFIDLTALTARDLALLKSTPGSAIGSSRYPMEAPDYEKALDEIAKADIGYVLFTGGNGTMDTLGKLYAASQKRHYELYCDGIPKTVDNDIAITDHAPGFPSIARYMALSTLEVAEDLKGLPIHVVILEAMGRDAGWVTAASALARQNKGDAPDLIYCPELPFDEETFLKDVQSKWNEHHGVLVVASEGLHTADGQPICPPIFKSGRATYFGDVGTHLAEVVIRKLGIKARSEKPGLLARASSSLASPIDVAEAVALGGKAASTVLAKKTGYMVGLKRLSDQPYRSEEILIPVEQVMLEERTMPRDFINATGNDVTDKFISWAKPLVGELPEMANLLGKR